MRQWIGMAMLLVPAAIGVGWVLYIMSKELGLYSTLAALAFSLAAFGWIMLATFLMRDK